MILGGFQPLTLTDFPGRVACIVFTQGCNLRCGYCHNPQLISHHPTDANPPTEAEIFAFLEKRRNKLDGVVVSGGEPTLQSDLIDFLTRVRLLGFLVKLDTNGTNPLVLAKAIERKLLDYVAMDVKHVPSRYVEITGVAVDPGVLAESRDLLLSAGIDHEFRTTILPQLHDEAAIDSIARFCAKANRLVLQRFRPVSTAAPEFRNCPAPTVEQLQRFQDVAGQFVSNVKVAELDAASGACSESSSSVTIDTIGGKIA